jgi:hypothetical protein
MASPLLWRCGVPSVVTPIPPFPPLSSWLEKATFAVEEAGVKGPHGLAAATRVETEEQRKRATRGWEGEGFPEAVEKGDLSTERIQKHGYSLQHSFRHEGRKARRAEEEAAA